MEQETPQPSAEHGQDADALLRVPEHHLAPYVKARQQQIHLFHLGEQDRERRKQAVERYRNVTLETAMMSNKKVKAEKDYQEARAAIIRAALQKAWIQREKMMEKRKESVRLRRRAAQKSQLLKRRLVDKKAHARPSAEDPATIRVRVKINQTSESNISPRSISGPRRWSPRHANAQKHPNINDSSKFYNRNHARLLEKVLQQPDEVPASHQMPVPEIFPDTTDKSYYFIPDEVSGGGTFVPAYSSNMELQQPSTTYMTSSNRKSINSVLEGDLDSQSKPKILISHPTSITRRPRTVPKNAHRRKIDQKTEKPAVPSSEGQGEYQAEDNGDIQALRQEKRADSVQSHEPSVRKAPKLNSARRARPPIRNIALGYESTLPTKRPRVQMQGPGGFRASSAWRGQVTSNNASVKMVSLVPHRPNKPAAVALNQPPGWHHRMISRSKNRHDGTQSKRPTSKAPRATHKQTTLGQTVLLPFQTRKGMQSEQSKREKNEIRWLPLQTPKPEITKVATASNWSSALFDGKDFVVGRTQMDHS